MQFFGLKKYPCFPDEFRDLSMLPFLHLLREVLSQASISLITRRRIGMPVVCRSTLHNSTPRRNVLLVLDLVLRPVDGKLNVELGTVRVAFGLSSQRLLVHELSL